jgi:hypothetical protein
MRTWADRPVCVRESACLCVCVYVYIFGTGSGEQTWGDRPLARAAIFARETRLYVPYWVGPQCRHHLCWGPPEYTNTHRHTHTLTHTHITFAGAHLVYGYILYVYVYVYVDVYVMYLYM